MARILLKSITKSPIPTTETPIVQQETPIVQQEKPIVQQDTSIERIDRRVGLTLSAPSKEAIAPKRVIRKSLTLRTVSTSKDPNTRLQASRSLNIQAKNYLRSLAEYYPAITYYRPGTSYAHGGIDSNLSLLQYRFGHQNPPSLSEAKKVLSGNPKYAHMFMPFCSACELKNDNMFAFKNITGVFFDSNLEELPEGDFKNSLIELIHKLLEEINNKDSNNQEVDMNTLPILIDQAVQEANRLTNSSVELHTASLFRLANLGLFYFSHFNTFSIRNIERSTRDFLTKSPRGDTDSTVFGLKPFENQDTLAKFDNLASQLVSGETTDPKIVLLNLPDFDIPEQYRIKLQEGINQLSSQIVNRTTIQNSSTKPSSKSGIYREYEDLDLI
jgi:hypothetical protein